MTMTIDWIKLLPLLLLFYISSLFAEEIPLFSPPAGWQCAPPKTFSEHVRIGFVGAGKNSFFRPSINLAVEKAHIALKDYVIAVKKIHHADPLIQMRDLGESFCKMGPAHLLELTSQTPYGEVRILQLLFVHEQYAYVLTGAVLKEEYMDFYGAILKAFHSLTLVNDLSSLLSDKEKEQLEKQLSLVKNSPENQRKKSWKNFSNFLLQNHKEQGSYWQILFLKETYEKMFKTP